MFNSSGSIFWSYQVLLRSLVCQKYISLVYFSIWKLLFPLSFQLSWIYFLGRPNLSVCQKYILLVNSSIWTTLFQLPLSIQLDLFWVLLICEIDPGPLVVTKPLLRIFQNILKTDRPINQPTNITTNIDHLL